MANKKSNTNKASGLPKGVWFDKARNLFAADIKKDGHKHHLGRFKTPAQASAAYSRKAVELFGEYARSGLDA